MILGLDHLAINLPDLTAALPTFAELGYRTEFHESDLLNHPAKQPLLHTMCDRHAIALLKHPSAACVTLELTRHAACTAVSHPTLLPLWGLEPDQLAGSIERETTMTADALPVIGVPCGDERRGPMGTRLRSAACDADLEFWQRGVGMKPENAADSSGSRPSLTRLVRQSPIPAWSFSLELESDLAATRATQLDDLGATCIALLVSDADRDQQRLLAAGGRDATEVFSLTVHDQPLRIALLRSPGGHCVELIEQPKRNR